MKRERHAHVGSDFTFHRKVIAAGNRAAGAWARILSMSRETDGFVTAAEAASVGSVSEIRRLVDVCLLDRLDEGYRIHNFLTYNAPFADVVAASKRDRERKIRGSIRDQVVARDGNVCGICGCEVNGRIHVDHVTPVVAGGKTEASNLRVTHPACNLRKGATVVR